MSVDPNKVVYHGTCVEKWNSDGRRPAELYLTESLGKAEDYAREWVEDEESENPIVVAFRIGDLQRLGVKFEPNWEYLDQIGNPDLGWEETLDQVGTFSVSGFKDEHKCVGTIIEVALEPDKAITPTGL